MRKKITLLLIYFVLMIAATVSGQRVRKDKTGPQCSRFGFPGRLFHVGEGEKRGSITNLQKS